MIEDRYRHFLKLTGEPSAAATLVLAETTAESKPENALTPKQAAGKLGVSVDLIYELCQSGKLRSQKIGRAVRIRPRDLDDYRNAA
jgi:excisionase family DNA binding protein